MLVLNILFLLLAIFCLIPWSLSELTNTNFMYDTINIFGDIPENENSKRIVLLEWISWLLLHWDNRVDVYLTRMSIHSATPFLYYFEILAHYIPHTISFCHSIHISPETISLLHLAKTISNHTQWTRRKAICCL